MASLVAWLAYGGARKVDGTPVASGYAYFYQPGTTATVVSAYSDEDGLVAVSQPVRLDASGRAVVYTRVAARVDVQDSAGASVQLQDRANTITAAQVEIENALATGTDLTTGSQVAGGRTDLNTFLSALYDSLGTADGLVLVAGVARRIKDVLAATTSLFFNVADAAYGGGAQGDDSTDDSAAIQAAISAAATAGGGIVYFPPGTYKTTIALVVTTNTIQMMGGGTPGAVTIKQYTQNLYALDITATDVFCSNITFATAHATQSLVIARTSSTDVRFLACNFALSHATTNAVVVGAGARVSLTACLVLQSSVSAVAFNLSATGIVEMIGGRLVIPTASSASPVSGAAGSAVTFTGVEVNHTAASGTTYMADATSGLVVVFSGCHFTATGGGTLKLSQGGSASVVENGCFLSTNVQCGTISFSSWRDARWLRTSGSATTYTPDPSVARYHEVISSGASLAFVNPTIAPSPIGISNSGGTEGTSYELVLRYSNASGGGAITPTFGTNYKIGTAPSVANGQTATWTFHYEPTLGKWVQEGGNPVAYTT